MKKKVNIVHVGLSGIPHSKGAAVNRCLALYAIFGEDDYTVLAINNRAMHAPTSENKKTVKSNGKIGNLQYLYTTPTPFRANSFIKRRYYSFIGRWNEIVLLFKLGFKKKLDLVFFYPDGDFFELILYRFITKLFRAKLITHYVEYRTSFNHYHAYAKFNDTLFDKYFMYFTDGIIPISEYLISSVKKKRPRLPMIKIPPLSDYNFFDKIEPKKTDPYFLYVGSALYFSAIQSILEAYKLVENATCYLYLVVHGNGIDSVRTAVNEHPKKQLIKIVSNLPYAELVGLYKSATALLIPLSDSLKDEARFPQKIAEYLASKNPIITTYYGEIKYYFVDRENALIAMENTAKLLSEKMTFVVDNLDQAKEIGLNGYKTGKAFFDQWSYKEKLIDFCLTLRNNRQKN
ncbi:glycosyltransferase [Flavobacteriaceae bacterium F08102]|nr:glycosyltransferase [Flavobacteriaceae bacterium F08102]